MVRIQSLYYLMGNADAVGHVEREERAAFRLLAHLQTLLRVVQSGQDSNLEAAQALPGHKAIRDVDH